MRGLIPLLPTLLVFTQPWSVAGVLPTGMIEFKSTKGYTYCAGGVRCCGAGVWLFVIGLRWVMGMTQGGGVGTQHYRFPLAPPLPSLYCALYMNESVSMCGSM